MFDVLFAYCVLRNHPSYYSFFYIIPVLRYRSSVLFLFIFHPPPTVIFLCHQKKTIRSASHNTYVYTTYPNALFWYWAINLIKKGVNGREGYAMRIVGRWGLRLHAAAATPLPKNPIVSWFNCLVLTSKCTVYYFCYYTLRRKKELTTTEKKEERNERGKKMCVANVKKRRRGWPQNGWIYYDVL